MRSRRRSCLLTLLLAMTVNHHTPVVSASVILRGRWSATIDEADASSSSGLNGKFDHLQSLMQVLRDHRRPLSASSLTRLDSGMANRLLPAFDRQIDEAGEVHSDDESRNSMLSSSDDDVRQLGDHRRSLSPGESDKSRLEQYQDEVQKIKDAFGDDSWYGDEVPMPENEDTISGILNPFRRHVESVSTVNSRLHRHSRAVDASQSYTATQCDKLRHLVNESCNSYSKTVKSCQSYLMCVACNTDSKDECALRHVTSNNSPCFTSGDDVIVTCRKQLIADMHSVLPVNVGACAEHLQCSRFHVV